MRGRLLILAVVALALVVAPSEGFAAPPPPDILLTQSTFLQAALTTGINGEIGMYLVGTWDNSSKGAQDTNNSTEVDLVNPSPKDLWAFVTYWSPAEEALLCQPLFVSANGWNSGGSTGTISGWPHGAIKVLVTNTNGRPEYGLVGYRQAVRRDGTSGNLVTISEIRLQPVPTKVLYADPFPQDQVPDELKKIICLCQPTSPVGVSLNCPTPP